MGSGTNPEQPTMPHLGSGGPKAPLPSRVFHCNKLRWQREKQLQRELRQFIKDHGMPPGVNPRPNTTVTLPPIDPFSHLSPHHQTLAALERAQQAQPQRAGNDWMDCNGGWGPQWYQQLQRIAIPELRALKRRFIKNTPPTEQEWRNLHNHVNPDNRLPDMSPLPSLTPEQKLEQQAMDAAKQFLIRYMNTQEMSMADKQLHCSRKGLHKALQLGFLPQEALVIADNASKLPIEQIDEKKFPWLKAQLHKQEIEKELSCGICFQPLQDPVMLCVTNTGTNTQCMHRFCKGCIDQHFERGKTTCVLCKAKVKPSDVVKDRFASKFQPEVHPSISCLALMSHTCAAGGHTHQSLKGELVWMTTLRLNGAAAFGSCCCLIALLPLAGAPEALNGVSAHERRRQWR